MAEGSRFYVDASSLGLGAAFSAANLRAGMQIPLQGPWSYAPEAQAYVTFPSDTLFVQVAAAVIFRFRPWEKLGLYLGAGPGLGLSDSRALAPAGGPSAAEQVGVKAYAIAEAGWTIQFWSFPVYLEPFARGIGAAGLDRRSGSAVSAGDSWSLFPAVDIGFRAGWRL
jgi:hypothetical protein